MKSVFNYFETNACRTWAANTHAMFNAIELHEYMRLTYHLSKENHLSKEKN